MRTHEELVKEALSYPEVKAEYDALYEEYYTKLKALTTKKVLKQALRAVTWALLEDPFYGEPARIISVDVRDNCVRLVTQTDQQSEHGIATLSKIFSEEFDLDDD